MISATVIAVSLCLYTCFIIWSVAVVWLLIDRLLNIRFHPRAQAYRYLLKWPALAGILSVFATYLLYSDDHPGPEPWVTAFLLTFWFIFRDYGGGDPPKNERPRVRARLKQVGGRLVIVRGDV